MHTARRAAERTEMNLAIAPRRDFVLFHGQGLRPSEARRCAVFMRSRAQENGRAASRGGSIVAKIHRAATGNGACISQPSA